MLFKVPSNVNHPLNHCLITKNKPWDAFPCTEWLQTLSSVFHGGVKVSVMLKVTAGVAMDGEDRARTKVFTKGSFLIQCKALSQAPPLPFWGPLMGHYCFHSSFILMAVGLAWTEMQVRWWVVLGRNRRQKYEIALRYYYTHTKAAPKVFFIPLDHHQNLWKSFAMPGQCTCAPTISCLN